MASLARAYAASAWMATSSQLTRTCNPIPWSFTERTRGSQTTATVIRALAVGDIDIKSASAVFGRELRTSLVLGALLAAMAFGLATVWGNGPMVGLVVASSIFAIVIWADCVGALLPLAVAKLGMDPAVVSGPLMSTLVDATGLLIYFTIASVLLGA